MTDDITLEKITLVGFRAYLKPRTFILQRGGRPISYFIYGPNGRGKSSLVDSLEYYFSKDRTLKRLGQRLSLTQAGCNAIRHVDAANEIVPSVHMWFRQGGEKFDDLRAINSGLPYAAKKILNLAKVPFVIRGHELRHFVECASATGQYKELIGWFELEPFLAVQNNLKDLKSKVDNMIDDTAETNERLRDLASMTDDALQDWNEPAVLGWLNDMIITTLGKPLKFMTLLDNDPALQKLKHHAQTEQKQSGLETLKNLLGVVDELRGQPVTGLTDSDGHIRFFEAQVSKYKVAANHEGNIRSVTSESVFDEIWEKAKDLLESNVEFDECPVCGTKFIESPRKSRSNAHDVLRINLDKLKKYREAESAKNNAKNELLQAASKLKTALEHFSLLIGSMYSHTDIDAYSKAMLSWVVGAPAPDSNSAANMLVHLHDRVNKDIERIEQQGQFLYNDTLATVNKLFRIKSELKRIQRTKKELRIIRKQLDMQALEFDTAITGYIATLISELQEDIRSLYACIQGPHVQVPLIHIDLAKEDATNQRTARMLIDFADNCKGVLPSGFLSDSQIHTLALSIRLAAIRKFNVKIKILALDDIVTSYDMDHRKSIAMMLNQHFGDFQILLTTHDRHFFDILKDHFHESHCEFHKIKELQSGVGPIFETHQVRDEEIEDMLNNGVDAENNIRKAEEEWPTAYVASLERRLE